MNRKEKITLKRRNIWLVLFRVLIILLFIVWFILSFIIDCLVYVFTLGKINLFKYNVIDRYMNNVGSKPPGPPKPRFPPLGEKGNMKPITEVKKESVQPPPAPKPQRDITDKNTD